MSGCNCRISRGIRAHLTYNSDRIFTWKLCSSRRPSSDARRNSGLLLKLIMKNLHAVLLKLWALGHEVNSCFLTSCCGTLTLLE